MTTVIEELRDAINNASHQDMPLQSIKDDLNVLLDEAEMNGVISEIFSVTAAQIKNDLQAGGVVISSTPAVDKFIWPLGVLIRYIPGVTPYTHTGADNFIYVSTAQEYLVESNGGYWATMSNTSWYVFTFPDLFVMGATLDDMSVAGVVGQPLSIFSGGAGNHWDGGDGTFEVTTSYVLLDA